MKQFWKHKKIFMITVLLVFTGVGLVYSAIQTGTNYQIESDVISGGGGESGSTNYFTGHTTGQSTATGESLSSNYRNHAGFWHEFPLSLVEAFVTRFYQQCLNRTPDPAGLAYWVDSLLDGSLTGADVAQGFVFSQEFVGLNTTKEEYLTVLYRAFFDRDPDSGGFNYWFSQLNSGVSREDVLDGFIFAQEFIDLSESYGIIAFRTDPRALVEAFVTRFYQQCLSRDPDQGGLDYWANALLDGTLTGADVAEGFVFSQEFVDRNTTDEEYLTILYRAFFDREPDSGGFAYWLDQLDNGAMREDVLDGFIFAQEFVDLSDAYGITPF